MESKFCDTGSGWACNELGILQADLGLDHAEAAQSIEEGCELGFQPTCGNVERMIARSGPLKGAPPTLDDYPIILRGSKSTITGWTPSALYARACGQGWPDTCGRAGQAAQ